MNKITLGRWQEANQAEIHHWDVVTSNEKLLKQEDGYYRHAEIMFLTTDNPSGLSVVDVGGGPLSLLLHHDLGVCAVIDPIRPSDRFIKRYDDRNIEFVQITAEEYIQYFRGNTYDEIWMYNCLQHTIDPEYILDNLNKLGKVLRISEPTNTPTDTLHPHTFTPEWLFSKLESISTVSMPKRVDYDYPYCGGKYLLK